MKIDTEKEQIQFFTKIQEAKSSQSPTLLNKEMGNYVHVELYKTIKLKNCVDSQKTNAELYKRFSKNFISNIQKGVNQLLISCGLEQMARLQTSVGSKNNPGMMLILGIGILDLKYHEDFTKYDVEVSFMEYRDGNLYDLLVNTKTPLKMIKKDQNICFGQSYCKIATFNHFLKLLKIALFNNKQRDQKNDLFNIGVNCQKVKSTLLMIIETKKYLPSGNTQSQKTTFVDFASSWSSTQSNNQKNVWDYILIELNNLSGKKKLHYHLVQANPLLELCKNNLKYGKAFLLNSFSSSSQFFQQNYKYFSELTELIDLISKQNESIGTSQQPLISRQSALVSGNSVALIQPTHENKLSQAQYLQLIIESISGILSTIRKKKYNSLRQFRWIKDKNLVVIHECVDWISSYKKVILKMMENKRIIKVLENQMLADQMKLIGGCIKSEHYKQFYNSKSYLSLQREISIKTEDTREQLNQYSKIKYQIKDRFVEMKLKNSQYIQTVSGSNDQLTDVKVVASKILDFFSRIFYNIIFLSQRTIVDEILKQQDIQEYMHILQKKLAFLDNQICLMGKKGQIIFQTNEYKKDAHLVYLVKEVKSLIRKQQKNSRKSYKGGLQMKENKNEEKIQSKNKTKFTKLPALSQKGINFQITGNINISNFLFDPTEILSTNEAKSD